MRRRLEGTQKLRLEDARHSLAFIWFGGAAVLFLILMVQSILGKYQGELQEAWAWFVPTVVPTLSLMLGVIGADALISKTDARRVKKPFFFVARGLSLFYLGALLLTILLEPFAPTPGIQLLTLSNYWMSPIQGLVVAAIGVLFAAQEKEG